MSKNFKNVPKQSPRDIAALYQKSESAGLIKMLTAVSGREKIAEYGDEQQGSYISDGMYLVEFEGDVALMVEYHGEESYGYCDTCGGTTPAYVEYVILRDKKK
jgi:hypothetical protein